MKNETVVDARQRLRAELAQALAVVHERRKALENVPEYRAYQVAVNAKERIAARLRELEGA